MEEEAYKINRSAFSIGSLHDGGDEKAYWLSKTPQERIEAIEIMRQILYGYDPSTTRLERFFEIADSNDVVDHLVGCLERKEPAVDGGPSELGQLKMIRDFDND